MCVKLILQKSLNVIYDHILEDTNSDVKKVIVASTPLKGIHYRSVNQLRRAYLQTPYKVIQTSKSVVLKNNTVRCKILLFFLFVMLLTYLYFNAK